MTPAAAEAIDRLLATTCCAEERNEDGTVWTYRDEFEAFRQSTAFLQDALHLLEWQQIRDWILTQRAAELGFVQDRLVRHPLL